MLNLKTPKGVAWTRGFGGPDTLCVYASCRAEQSSAVQCSAVCSAVQCSAVQCAVQRSAERLVARAVCNNVTRTADEDKAAFDDILLVEAAQCLAEREAICGHQRCNVWRALARPL
jgi:hypothetical protein